MARGHDISTLLQASSKDDPCAASELMPLVYDELRALAARFMAGGAGGHTLQPTAVVHEAFQKLAGGAPTTWEGRAHFFAVAAKAMRQVLTDYARRKKTRKRGGELERITLSELGGSPLQEGIDLLALDEALAKLAELDARQADIVEKRFLAGLDVEETAHVMGISPRTVEREWLVAKAWLRRELSTRDGE